MLPLGEKMEKNKESERKKKQYNILGHLVIFFLRVTSYLIFVVVK